MNILKSGTYKSEASIATQVRVECEAAIKAITHDLKRAFEIWDAYLAINGSQWTREKRAQLQEEDRYAWQFDVLTPKVDTLAGVLISELPDLDWYPIAGEPTAMTEAVREQYFDDKDLFNYEDAILHAVRDGCIHSGWLQMGVSKKYKKTGNIILMSCRPGYIIPDPYWKTDDDRDLQKLYKIGYYKPDDLAAKYQKQSDKILEAAAELEKRSSYFSQFSEQTDDLQKQFKPQAADEYRVIEKHYIETKSKKRLIGAIQNKDGQMSQVNFPITDDGEYLSKFAEINNIDWTDVNDVTYEDKIHKILTVTDLDPDIILEEGDSATQVHTGLPFFHFTCTRYNGHDKGIAESILDIQRVINEKESLLLEFIAKASGGSMLVNEDLFPDNNKKEEFRKGHNKAGRLHFVDLDGVEKTVVPIGPATVPAAIFNEIQRMYDQTLPLVSRVSDAMSAITETNESGVLFEKKYQMNRVANVILDKGIKRLQHNIGEAYFYQFQQVNSDIPMKVQSINGEISLNEKHQVNGAEIIINSVSDMPRHKCVISESTKTPVFQLRKRMEIEGIIKNIPPNDNLRLQQALAIYFENTPMSDEDRAKMDEVNSLEMMKAKLQMFSEIANLEAQTLNAKMQSTQLQQMMSGGGQQQPPNQITQQPAIPQNMAGQQAQEQNMFPPQQQRAEPALMGA